MLYLNRIVRDGVFIVTDTDDGTSERVTFDELQHVVCDLGVEVKGVTVFTSDVSYPKIGSVVPYRAESTAKTAKTAVRYGVDIITNGNVITSISAPRGLNQDYVELRLSDYGRSCGGCIFGYLNVSLPQCLVFVIDDKIRLTQKTIDRFKIRIKNVHFDVTHCTRRETLNAVYHAFPISEVKNVIFDGLDRMCYMCGVKLLKGDEITQNGSWRFKYTVGEDAVKRVSPVIEKEYRSTLFGVDLNSLTLRTNETVWSGFFYNCEKCLAFRQYGSYENAKAMVDDLRDWIVYTYKCNKTQLDFLARYVRYFEPTEEFKDYFIGLCKQAIGKSWRIDMKLEF